MLRQAQSHSQNPLIAFEVLVWPAFDKWREQKSNREIFTNTAFLQILLLLDICVIYEQNSLLDATAMNGP